MSDYEDDPVMPEDLYFVEITEKIKLKDDDMEDIENLDLVAPAPSRPRDQLQPSDPSDTLYGANTNTYTTDDNVNYPNPSLLSNPRLIVQQESMGTCRVENDDPCACGQNTKSGCCGEDDDYGPTSAEDEQKQTNKQSCGDDCGCSPLSEFKTVKKKESCGDACGCSSGLKTPIPEDIKPSTNTLEYDNLTSNAATNIPGVGVVYIKTWGCSHNTSDGEYMAGLLQQAGYTITNDDSTAQVVILNSCSVKNPSETSLLNSLEYYKKQRQLGVVVAGCVPQAHPSHPMLATYSGKAKALSSKKLKKLQHKKIILEQQREAMIAGGRTPEEVDASIKTELDLYKSLLMKQHKKQTQDMLNKPNTAVFRRDDPGSVAPSVLYDSDDEEIIDTSLPAYAGCVSVLGTDNIHRVVEVVDSTLQGHSMSLLTNNTRNRPANALSLPKIRKNPFVEIISISTGCLNNCTYCKTKQARGNLRSYPIEEIVSRVKSSLEEGVIEIWLTSEDLGAYGIDLGVRVHDLVNAILAVMKKGTMLRMGMSNPPYFKDILPQMYSIFEHPLCYEFLHIPVQAGADTVLNDMKRDYTNYEFQTICDALIENIPTITLATDFICGFPSETDDDWESSVKLLNKYKFPVVFINQFYPRPGTPAHDMPQLPAQVLKGRSKELVTLFNSYNTRAGREGEVQDVLVTDMSRDNLYMVGHTKQYDQVLIPSHPKIMGKMVKIKIVKAEKHYFISELMPGAVEEANKTPTILPVNYKFWSFAPYIDSNIESFIKSNPPESSSPTGANVTIKEKKALITTKTSGIDDEDDLATLTQRKVQSSKSDVPITPAVITESEPMQQPQKSPLLVPFEKNKSMFATDMVNKLRTLEDYKNLTDEEVRDYAERAARGDVPCSTINEEDLDPKRQVAMGVIFILILLLLWRRIA